MNSFVQFVSRFVLFASALRLLWGPQPAQAAEPTSDKLSVLFLGIHRGSSDEQTTAAPLIESAVAARLKSLGFEIVESPGGRRTNLVSRTPSTEVCRSADCLSARAIQAGTNFALSGSVLRVSDLCSADLWLYDRRADKTQRAEIHCQPKTPDTILADEFADHAGRLSEPKPEGVHTVATPAVGPTTPQVPLISRSTKLARERPSHWTRGRLAAVEALAIASTALWATSITLYAVNCPSGICQAQVGTSEPVPLNNIRAGFISGSCVALAGLALSLFLPEKKR